MQIILASAFLGFVLITSSCGRDINLLGNLGDVGDQEDPTVDISAIPGSTSGASAAPPPVVSSFSDQNLLENSSTVAIAFTISSSEGALDCSSSVSIESSNPALIDSSGVVFSGIAPNCTVVFTPKTNQVGTAELTISVTNGTSVAQTSFTLTSVSGLVLDSGAFEYVNGTIAQSCSEYLASSSYNTQGDAVYWVDPDGPGGAPEYKAFCDMTRNGGGWMLVLKSATQPASWYAQTASVNEADCLDAASANINNCSNLNVYNSSVWTEMMGDNRAAGHTPIIAKNNARSTLQDHLTGASLTDANVTPFLRALYTGSPAGAIAAHSEWNGIGAVNGRHGVLIADTPGSLWMIIGGESRGSCNRNFIGNVNCALGNINVWLWIR